MNIENTKKLIEAAPILFGSVSEECKKLGKKEPFLPIAFGFECEDGWFDLIMDTAKKLEALNKGITAFQVKEKFGGLRFYINEGSDAAFAIIDEAERASFKVCEICGKEGKLKGYSWLRTLCDQCYEDG